MPRSLPSSFLFTVLAAGLPGQQWQLVTPTVAGGPATRVRDGYLRLEPTSSGRMFQWDGGGWRETGQMPAGRYPTALAFDPVTGDTVAVFSINFLAETWILRNGSWLLQAAPTLGVNHLVFDPASQRVMAIRMPPSPGPCTCEHWTGSAWVTLTHATRPCLLGSAIAADPQRNRIVAFGGFDAATAINDQTWEWNGADWQLQPGGPYRPAPRTDAAMVFDEANGHMVMFGGRDNTGTFQDTSTWNGTSWTAHAAAHTPPADALDHRMTFDRTRGTTIMFAARHRAAWEWNGADWRLLPESVTPRISAAVTDLGRNRLVAIGTDGGFEYDGRLWTSLPSTPSPPVRNRTALAYLPGPGVVCFGGFGDASNQFLDDTWSWNGVVWQQHQGTPRPRARTEHGLAWHPASGGVILFGGVHAIWGFFNDTWLWNGTTWSDLTATLATSPPRRLGQGLGLHLPTGELVLPPGQTNETWLWNGAWRSVTPAAPPGVSGSLTALLDPQTNNYLVVGSFNAGPGAFMWNGSSWLPQMAPPVEPETAAADPLRNRLLVFQGHHYISSATLAGSATFGSGCGNPPPQLDTCGGHPRIGRDGYQLRVFSLPGLGAVFLAMDTATTTMQLPGGCTQLLPAPQVLGLGIANQYGHARFLVPVPAAAQLRGLQVAAQAVALVPQGPLLGSLALSQGLLLTVGD